MSAHITFPRDHPLPPGDYLLSCTGEEEWACAPVRHGATQLLLGHAVPVDVRQRPAEHSRAAELSRRADEAINALDHAGASAACRLRAAALLGMCWIVGRTIGIDTPAWQQAGDLPRLCLDAVMARHDDPAGAVGGVRGLTVRTSSASSRRLANDCIGIGATLSQPPAEVGFLCGGQCQPQPAASVARTVDLLVGLAATFHTDRERRHSHHQLELLVIVNVHLDVYLAAETMLGELPQRAYGALHLRRPGKVRDDVDPHPSKHPPKNPQSLLMSGDHRDLIRTIVENEWATTD